MCDEDKQSGCAWPLIKGTFSRAGLLQASAISGASSTSSAIQQQGGRYVRSISSIHRLNQSSHSVVKCAVIIQHIAGDIAGVSSSTAVALQVTDRFEVWSIADLGVQHFVPFRAPR
jgi:hypothetical protein